MDNLSIAREKINNADKEIARLFCERMEAVKSVAEYKMERGLPILDEGREKALTEKNLQYIENEELKSYYVMFLRSMMEVSKNYQHRLMDGLNISFSGVEGAFADIAAKRIFPDGHHIGFDGFSAAYNSVVDGKCDCAVLPIENSYAGVVGQVMDLMFEGGLFVNGIYTLPVTQNLLGVEGATVKGIKKVISHPQALMQCGEYIKRHGWETITEVNTAVAAKKVAETGDISVAAIANAETAKLYGLELLDHDINESAVNSTKFAVFSRAEAKNDKNNKFILMFTVNDIAGALAKAINVISDNGFNMKVLRSRPVKEKAWQYYFYVEAEGDENSPQGKKMLSELSKQCEKLKIAGHYSKEINLGGNV